MATLSLLSPEVQWKYQLMTAESLFVFTVCWNFVFCLYSDWVTDNICYYSTISFSWTRIWKLKQSHQSAPAVGFVVESRVCLSVRKQLESDGVLPFINVAVVKDFRLVSIRPHCSAGQEAKREVKTCSGVTAGQHPHFPDRTDGQITGRRDGRRSLRHLCSFMCHVSKMESCHIKSVFTVSSLQNDKQSSCRHVVKADR